MSATPRVAWIALILATLYFCYFHNLGAIGLVGPDEPRYAWIARDMAETGDWVTPRLYGKPWFEKPPLYYWSAALSFKLFGVSEVTARLPSAVAALLAALALAWLAWCAYGAETARWLLLLLPTTVGMIGFSHAAATDMPFAAMLTIALVFAARLLDLVPVRTFGSFASFTSSTSFSSLAFGFFLGLAALAKGPAAIVLSGGAVLFWAVSTKRWRDALRCLHPIAIVSFCAIALPWYILCARRNPDFLRVFIIEHNFQRYLTPEFQHIQPFWFYLPILLIAFIPWTLLLLWCASQGLSLWQRTRQLSPLTVFLLTWAVFCLLFFSVSKSKLPGYILPAVAPIGLLLARSYVCFVDVSKAIFRWIQCAAAAAALLLALVLWSIPFSASRINAHAATGAGWVLSLLAIANLILAVPPRKNFSGFITAPMCVLPVLILVVLFRPLATDFLPRDPSGKSVALELEKIQNLGTALGVDYYVARMSRGQQFSLSFYLHREIRNWESVRPADSFLILPSTNCESLVTPPWSCSRRPAELGSTGWFVFRVYQKKGN
jgi:4-amino-4-deoxy-L-arabinose transferase-like glycosyltransferase